MRKIDCLPDNLIELVGYCCRHADVVCYCFGMGLNLTESRILKQLDENFDFSQYGKMTKGPCIQFNVTQVESMNKRFGHYTMEAGCRNNFITSCMCESCAFILIGKLVLSLREQLLIYFVQCSSTKDRQRTSESNGIRRNQHYFRLPCNWYAVSNNHNNVEERWRAHRCESSLMLEFIFPY